MCETARMGKTQVYCGLSLDGFIAGPDDDLSWLGAPDPDAPSDPGAVSFEAHMAQTGVLMMGRRTFDVVAGFDGPWPYGETPVWVLTSRPLPKVDAPVTAVSGDFEGLCEGARAQAGDKNVYLDGGRLISQALDAGCVDELILTYVPVLLGRGVPLYAGDTLHRFTLESLGRLSGNLQVRLTKA